MERLNSLRATTSTKGCLLAKHARPSGDRTLDVFLAIFSLGRGEDTRCLGRRRSRRVLKRGQFGRDARQLGRRLLVFSRRSLGLFLFFSINDKICLFHSVWLTRNVFHDSRGGARARCSSADGARAREGTRWGWGNLMLDELSIRMDAREEGTTDARGFVWDEGWW